MKRTLFTVMVALAILTGAYSIAGAADGPHTDYRPDASDTSNSGRYYGGCNGAACHITTSVTFLPTVLDTTAPNEKDYTNFCLACHNAAGEAHNKSAGTPSNNVYKGSTTILGNSGVSHSWNGNIHNAGTTTPTSPGFVAVVDGTDYMPGTNKRVTCQTCHNAMTKNTTNNTTQNIENWVTATSSNGTSYTILGYPNTSQYLGKYIKVYRSNGGTPISQPYNTRDRYKYLVDPSQYTYNPLNGTITFNTSQTGNSIYVEIPQPYLRVDNTANAICLDCHRDRTSSSVSHAPGTGTKNGHPVSVNYGYNFGLHSTLKPSATGNAYTEGGKVYCTSCHDPHNAASKNGQIMREADDQTLCGDCHKTKLGGYSTAGSVNIHNGSKHLNGPTVCLDCHSTHNDNNIMLIKSVINGKTINFQNFSGANSFGNDSGSSICEACHSTTSHHLASNDPSGQGHNTGKNCIICHKHETGFQATGCTTCHGQPPAAGSVPSGWAGDGEKHTAHMGYILTKFGLSGTNACACCHGSTIPRADHNNPANCTAGIDTTSPIYWNGGTFSNPGLCKNPTSDTCTNVACHSATGTRNWFGASGCDSCHPYPGSATNVWPSTNGHSIQVDAPKLGHMAASGYNAATDTYAAMVADPTRCGKCHPNVPSNHQNGTINLSPNGYAACGGGNFTINQTVTRTTVTCDNVLCHTGKTTPNWW